MKYNAQINELTNPNSDSSLNDFGGEIITPDYHDKYYEESGKERFDTNEKNGKKRKRSE